MVTPKKKSSAKCLASIPSGVGTLIGRLVLACSLARYWSQPTS